MTVREIADLLNLRPAAGAEGLPNAITSVFCCDLLSHAMARAPEESAWVTVMGNVNSVAVASLADVSCIVLAEGMIPDGEAVSRADAEGIPILLSDRPIFDTAKDIDRLLE